MQQNMLNMLKYWAKLKYAKYAKILGNDTKILGNDAKTSTFTCYHEEKAYY